MVMLQLLAREQSALVTITISFVSVCQDVCHSASEPSRLPACS